MPETNPLEESILLLINTCNEDLHQYRLKAYSYAMNFDHTEASNSLKQYIKSEKFQAMLETWQHNPGIHFLSSLPAYANENLPKDKVLIYIDNQEQPSTLYVSYKNGECEFNLQDPDFLRYLQLIRDHNLTFMDNINGTMSNIEHLFTQLARTHDKQTHNNLIQNFISKYNHKLLATYTQNEETLTPELHIKDSCGGNIFSIHQTGTLQYQPSPLSKHLATANDLWKKPETKAAVAAAGTVALGAVVVAGLVLKSVM